MTQITPAIWPEVLLSVLIGFCIAAGLVVAFEEWRWLRARKALSPAAKREMRLSLTLLPPNVLVSVLASPGWLVLFMEAEKLAPLHFEINPLTVVLAFLLADLTYYWEHRCAHRLSWLWSLYHAQHHSSPAYTVATAYRVSFVNQFFAPAFYLPMVLVGVPPLLVLGFQLVCFHYQAWLHTEMFERLGWLDHIFNTPANHRIHHSIDPRHRDRNFAAVLMIWDRVFGSYAAPEPSLVYGIPNALAPQTMFGIYSNPWRRFKRD